MFRRKKSDEDLLRTLAEYRLLDLSQITALHFSSKQVATKRLNQLMAEGFVAAVQRSYGRSRGRPDRLFSLGPEGIELLQDKAILRHSVPCDQVTGENLLPVQAHQWLVNWFRIHLIQIEKVLPNLKIDFLAPTSPFLVENSHPVPRIQDEVPVPESEEKTVKFTPDGVFSINDRDQGKTILFFIEVDMGTETLASPKAESNDIRQKVINYQSCFRTDTYKRFERLWKCRLNGFRLLFLAHNYVRMCELGRLVQAMPPSDFIWLTDSDQMFEQGLAGAIWARGGRYENARESILNPRMCRPSPILPIKS